MNPIILVSVFFAACLFFWKSLPYFTEGAKKKKENMIRKLCREGAAQNLVFCSQEVFQNKVMGFDGIRRKIMVLEEINSSYHCTTISLDEVHDCRVVFYAGLTKKDERRHANKRATTLGLQFEFNNHSESESIIFGNEVINSSKELVFLKAKAEYWSVMFSKMLNRKMEARA